MDASIARLPRQKALFAFPWIFGPRADLAVSIGGMAAGFALFFLYTVLGVNVLWVWFVWVVTLDTPHFFATYFRTYLDKVDWRANRTLLINSLGCFLIGPACLLAAFGLHQGGVADFKLPMEIFARGVAIWAYWHVVRQHYGILRLYNRKGGELGGAEPRIDAIVLYGCLGLAFVGLLLRHPQMRPVLGLGDWHPLPSSLWYAPVSTFSALPPDQALFVVTFLAVCGLTAFYFVHQLRRVGRGEPVMLPKLVFLASVVFLHSFMAFSGLLPASTVLGFTAVVTIYHDIQYFAVVWFYARNRYGRTAEERKPFGAAGFLAQSFPLFLVTGIVFISLPLWGLGCVTNRVEICGPGHNVGAMTFMGDTTFILFFMLLTAGFQIHHYVLDQFIWRPGRSRELRRQLNLEVVAAE